MKTRANSIWFFVLLMAGCGTGIQKSTRIEPGKQLTCPDGSTLITIDCSTDVGLKERVMNVNAKVPYIDLGIGGSYEERAAGQITDSTYQLALKLEALCKDYNACLLKNEEYVRQAKAIRERLNNHVELAEKATKSPEVGDALWSNAVPEMAEKRLKLEYRLEAMRKATSSLTLHQDGGVLHSGDGLRFVAKTNQSAYVYILLLSSQGEAAQLFPQSEIGLSNPLPGEKEIRIPSGEDVFELDKVTGTETIQILASTKPLKDLEQRLAELGKGGEGKGSEKLLSSIGGTLCDEETGKETETETGKRGIKLKKSSVKCGETSARGLNLKKASGEKSNSVLAARPNDNVIVFQHHIDHK